MAIPVGRQPAPATLDAVDANVAAAPYLIGGVPAPGGYYTDGAFIRFSVPWNSTLTALKFVISGEPPGGEVRAGIVTDQFGPKITSGIWLDSLPANTTLTPLSNGETLATVDLLSLGFFDALGRPTGIPVYGDTTYWAQISTTENGIGDLFIPGYADGTSPLDNRTTPTGYFGGLEVDGVVGFAPVREPSTWAMMLLGFAGLGFAAFRRIGKPDRGKAIPLRSAL